MTIWKGTDLLGLMRMRDGALIPETEGELPDHIFADDNGKRVYAECERCGLYMKVWSNDLIRKQSLMSFAEEHRECEGERFIPMEGEDDSDPYFADDNDRCPPMGLQEAVIR